MNQKLLGKALGFMLLLNGLPFLPIAQNTLGFSGTVAGGSAPSGNGPSTSPQVVTFHQSQAVASPPGLSFAPTTTVTFSLSNQQFTSIEGNPATAGMQFGALGNAGVGAVGNNVTGTPFWAGFGTVFGGNYTGNFTGCNACTVGNSSTTATGDGVRYTTLGSIGLMLYTDAMIQSSGSAIPAITDVNASGQPNLLGSFYYGDLTLTFNRPVSNPVLHIADIGGRVNYNTLLSGVTINYVLGFTTDYKLITPGLSLAKLSGTTSLSVSADSIWNNASLFGSPSNGETYAGQARTSASGSVVIQGTNITTVTFRLKLRGDGGAIRNSTGTTGGAATASLGNFVQWAVQGSFQPCHGTAGCTPASGLSLVSGDYIEYAVGLQKPVAVSGHLWHDVNAANVDSAANIATVPHNTIYANLIDANGKVVASQPIPTTPVTGAGYFQFDGVGEGTYSVSISTTPGVQGAAKPAESLPSGWQNTGEFNGAQNTGNDGDRNGVSQPFTVAATDVVDRNFAIQRGPESAINLQPTVGNPGGINNHTVSAGSFQTNNVGTTPNTQDYDGGTVTQIRLTQFPLNATSITVNGIKYLATDPIWPVNGGAGIVVPYADGAGPTQPILVDPVEGNVDVVIPFASRDNAGSEDATPGSVTIPFRTISLAGVVFNDLNGNAATNGNPEGGEAVINGTNTGGGIATGAVLYANLIDASNNVIATVPVQNDGTYFFPNVPQNTSGLTVQVSSNGGTIGSAKPATVVPAGWVTTGENKNGQAGTADGAANSEIPVATGIANITLQNFGIEQLPESAVNRQPDLVNPGSAIAVAVPPTAFQQSNVGANPNTQDYSGGTVTSIRITAFPSNATSIIINGVSYTGASWPIGGITIPAPGGIPTQTIHADPVDGIVDVVIPFTAIDNAGKEDPSPGSVTLPFTTVIPVRQLSLHATLSGMTVTINWLTENEINTAKFIAERSVDNRIFSAIGEKPATGNSAGAAYYSLTDDIAAFQADAVIYYRIKAMDIDGRYTYSKVVAVRVGLIGSVKIWPNPFGNQVNISFGSAKATTVQVRIIDNMGNVLWAHNYGVAKGHNQFEIVGNALLAKGIYTIELTDGYGSKNIVENVIKN